MKDLFKILILTIIGIPVFFIVFIIGFIYTTIKHIKRFDYSLKRQLDPVLKSIILSIDGLANAGAGEIINDVLKIKGKIKYGDWSQTISAVTGLVHLYEKDTKLRKFLDSILGKRHCYKAITKQEKFYYKYK